jgi:hypothetical protein
MGHFNHCHPNKPEGKRVSRDLQCHTPSNAKIQYRLLFLKLSYTCTQTVHIRKNTHMHAHIHTLSFLSLTDRNTELRSNMNKQ